MNIKRVLELTKILSDAWNELRKEVGDQQDLAEASDVPEEKSSRKDNRIRKNKIMYIFRTYPNRGFTKSDIISRVPGTTTMFLNGLLRYLIAGNILEQVGKAYRLKAPITESKTAKNGHSNGSSSSEEAEIQARILNVLSKTPSTLADLRKIGKCSYPRLHIQVKKLKKEGHIKIIKLRFKSASGQQLTGDRFALANYMPPTT